VVNFQTSEVTLKSLFVIKGMVLLHAFADCQKTWSANFLEIATVWLNLMLFWVKSLQSGEAKHVKQNQRLQFCASTLVECCCSLRSLADFLPCSIIASHFAYLLLAHLLKACNVIVALYYDYSIPKRIHLCTTVHRSWRSTLNSFLRPKGQVGCKPQTDSILINEIELGF